MQDQILEDLMNVEDNPNEVSRGLQLQSILRSLLQLYANTCSVLPQVYAAGFRKLLDNCAGDLKAERKKTGDELTGAGPRTTWTVLQHDGPDHHEL